MAGRASRVGRALDGFFRELWRGIVEACREARYQWNPPRPPTREQMEAAFRMHIEAHERMLEKDCFSRKDMVREPCPPGCPHDRMQIRKQQKLRDEEASICFQRGQPCDDPIHWFACERCGRRYHFGTYHVC